MVDPADAQVGKDDMAFIEGGQRKVVTDKDALKDVNRQWTMVFEVGAMF
jgi:hypothetical protein